MRRAALVAALAACALLCGCDGEAPASASAYGGRFEAHSTSSGGAYSMSVIVDRRTGVEYLRTVYGVCPLYEADGSLSIAEGVVAE